MSRYIEMITDPDCSYCIGCGVDVHLPDPVHAPICPMATGVWQVSEREITEEFSCTSCRHLFAIGEHYHGGEFVLCLGCAATTLKGG